MGKKRLFLLLQVISIITLLTFWLNCGSSNRLKEYQFRDQTAASILAVPPPPEVFTNSFFWVDGDDPIGSIIRVGTSIAKEVEARKVRARLDSAMDQVDVPEEITHQTLLDCARFLRYRPVDDPENCDYLFDFYIQEYGIEAGSWSATVYFKIDLQVVLLDQEMNRLIWKKKIKEKFPINSEIFGLGQALGDVVTAVTLSKLTVEQIENGFRQLADFTADRISRILYKDFMNSR
jgi:hypothetical protein